MCKDPNSLPDGTVVACRKCELCRYNRVKDWAGRNIAQSKVSLASFSCNLTYGPELDSYPVGHSGKYGMPIPGRSDHIRAAVLTYDDVQNFCNYLRTVLKYKFQYFVTGELGGLNHRAHWHIILHFLNKVPSHELRLNFSDRHVNQFGQLFKHEVCKAWPHGFMFWEEAKFEDVFYGCKYILKDEDDEEAQRKPGMSKKPPIGTEYFLRWADRFVQTELAPQKLEYWFPEVRKKDGKPLMFMLKGRTAEMFLERYISRWKEVHGDRQRPNSQLVDLFEEYGKIVTDEARMLLRQQFPKGESRQTFPKADWIKAQAAEAKAELEEKRMQMASETWQSKWVREANGEERQRRQEIIEFEHWLDGQQRSEQWPEFEQYAAKLGWQLVPGMGWVCSRAKPGESLRGLYLQWRHSKQSEPDKRGQRGEGISPESLGPVGTYNRNYGQGSR